MLSGGGTGGHITPVLAVASELKKIQPDCQIIYIAERGGKFAHIAEGNEAIDQAYTIFSGKFRRYHGESWLRRVLDVKTNVLNLRDLFYVAIGIIQSFFLLGRLRPNAVFLKGGFVGAPVGFASAMRHIPFVTHDSDALPGLANRLVARWAKYHATGMPPEFYSYPPESMRYVGVLTSADYQLVDAKQQVRFKQARSLPEKSRVLLVTGGSTGAKKLNDVMKQIVPKLLDDFSDLYIVHQVGKGQGGTYDSFSHPRLQVLEFLQLMYEYTGAADVVVTRAGGNTLAELAMQGKACVVVPNPLLTGGHQLKNAEDLVRKGAVIAVDEKDFAKGPNKLDRAIRELLQDETRRQQLAAKLHAMSVPDAARNLALLLLDVAK